MISSSPANEPSFFIFEDTPTLKRLLSALEKISRATSLDGIAQIALHYLLDLTLSSGGAIYISRLLALEDNTSDVLRLAALQNIPQELRNNLGVLAKLAMDYGKILTSQDTPIMHSKLEEHDFVCVPIEFSMVQYQQFMEVLKEATGDSLPQEKNGRIIGIIILIASAASSLNLSNHDMELLARFAKNIAIMMLEYIQIDFYHGGYENSKKQANRIKILNELSNALATQFDLDKLLDMIMQFIIQHTRSQRGFLMLFDDRGELQIEVSRNLVNDPLADEYIRISQSIVDRVVKTAKPVVITNISAEDTMAHQESVIDLELKSVIAIPMFAKDKMIGILYVDSKIPTLPTSREDIDFLNTLASQAAIAIENARLHNQQLAQQRIRQQVEHLKLVDQRKTEFLRTVAHELKAPISVISEYLRLLSDPTMDGDTKQRFLDIAQQETQRMSLMVRGLLDLFKIKSGSRELEISRLDLSELAGYTVNRHAAAAKKKNIALRVLSKKPFMVNADYELLLQVLSNLVTNAIKYHPGSGSVEILASHLDALSAKSLGLEENMLPVVLVEVADDGMGIPPEDMERIFEVFHRVSDHKAQKISGIGLGLTIAKSIIEAHGGKIWVERNIGKGSRFKFIIPRQPVSLKK